MTAETWSAIIAGATFMVFWTASILGLAAWISKQFRFLREDFDTKHRENSVRYEALNVLVIRHETMLHPEFNGGGPFHARGHRG